MSRAPLIMYAVAAVVGIAGAVVAGRPARSEGAVYARRIAATMLIVLALTLAFSAWSMANWEAGS
ncbi:MAG: hypothetical protein J0I47_08075 [Sphingomonas sp.]|uniref:hypothetical protein n=1 Tax=Sphingomonas sp. TaxID=28214 RepID=UPI001AC81AC2|nr:hypothetical protein [Sphingomonas sp.]MBN8808179.1 hypothetical protein [Sphingomonas sp.]